MKTQTSNNKSSKSNSNQENQNKEYLTYCSPDYDPEIDDYECTEFFDDTEYIDVPELGWDPEEEDEEE